MNEFPSNARFQAHSERFLSPFVQSQFFARFVFARPVRQAAVKMLQSAGVLVLAALFAVSCNRKPEPKVAVPSPADAYRTPENLPPPRPLVEELKPENAPHVAESNAQPTFVMNKDLVGGMIANAENNFRFAPPKTWKRFSQNELRVAAPSASLPPQSGMKTGLLYGFRDENTNSTLIVYSLSLPKNLQNAGFADQITAYAPYIEAHFRPVAVQPSGFVAGTLRIVQFRAQSKDRVTYQLVFNNSRKGLVILEFTMSKEAFKEDIQEIEPVIASMSLLKS